MMQPSQEIRSILFDILEQAFQPPDVSATQQMGVQLSNAVKREGVVIIQNQNVEVYARIVPSILRAIRLCDQPDVITHEPLQIEASTDEDPLEKACEWMFKRGYKWEIAQDAFRNHYLSCVVDHFKTKREAAQFLGMGPTYLSKKTNERKDS
jgi:hypothetical protein